VTRRLLEREVMDGQELRTLMGSAVAPAVEAAAPAIQAP